MTWRRRMHVEPVFRSRAEAGRRLAPALAHVAQDAVIVGLARGGVAVAAALASVLERPLDVLAVRKIGHPLQPEFAIGAVAPNSAPYVRGHESLSEEDVANAVAASAGEVETLDATLHAPAPALPLAGRTCVLVDDGLATGATMHAAVVWARQRGARDIVAAVPVGAPSTVAGLRKEADEVICLEEQPMLFAVSLHYEDFGQLEDTEVADLLARQR